MNIKNILCAILMMSAAFGNSVAVAVSPRFVALRVGVGVGAGVALGTLTGLICIEAMSVVLSRKQYRQIMPQVAWHVTMVGALAGGVVGLGTSCALASALPEDKKNDSFAVHHAFQTV